VTSSFKKIRSGIGGIPR